ncbi:polyisoprenoid-binding protein [Flavobacterium arcticum]|uniref:Polyisoprenoid-binding protein n=1 Tax=Flavobacterium arcticum TaxID=1784713 RepID=A0A345HE85_9FLAO|nr:YceI family protein [Flavobacterium arcticum]AXG74895.1 polyisoprenoid-binding protein [Flavobacterium arcticum]KAF2509607.1 YceI family protein [Flavobacterium arcticum]
MSTTKWVVDPTHSEIGFKVKHMMFTNLSGNFTKFDASVTTEGEDFKNAQFDFSADIDSVDTGNTDRDNHLKSGDFFNAEQHPKIIFTSTAFTQKSGDNYTLTGNLTISGTTKPVTLDVEFGGTAKDPWGNVKAGMSATGKINRKEFGLTWNAALESGGVLVGEDVKLNIELQFAKA